MMERKYGKIDKRLFSSIYQVTKDGRIFNMKTGYEYHPSFCKKGYKILRLPYPDSTNKDGRRPFKVHRLVAMIYLSDYDENLQVNHINGIKSDNRVENLEMVTNSQNAYHAWNHLDSSNRRKLLSDNNKKHNKLPDVAKAAEANRKQIAMLDETGNILKTFNSLTEASSAMNLKSLTAISYAVKHGTKSCNYYWKYL